jgi:steroid 5-alpha reductase family enzyme
MSLSTKIPLFNLVALLSLTMLLWGVSLRKRDVSIVDQFWGLGFVVVAWLTACVVDSIYFAGWSIVGLVTIWGLRLAGYLTWRKRGEGEDRRYAEMRRHHGQKFWWLSLFTVFLLQGSLIWFISLPVQATLWTASADPILWMTAIGVALSVFGIAYETVADLQLARFKATAGNERKVMDRGLWHFSRHPNYFGDFCVWWGFYAIAASAGAGWTIASPLVMSLLLLRVSGVSLLESTIGDRRPAYRKYMRTTSAFFPWRPRTG